MTRKQARTLAYNVARATGLDKDTADAVASRIAELHEVLDTDTDIKEDIDIEVQKHAQP
jgi:hypothetical protein